MKNLRSCFQAATMRGLTALPGRLLMRHCAWMTSLGYAGGNFIMMVKEGVNWKLDSVGGGILFVSSLSLIMARRYPVATFRVAGGLCVAGSSCLVAGALNLGHELPVNFGTLAGGALNVGIGALAGFQKEIAAYAENISGKAANIFQKAALGFARYPIIIAAGMDAAATAGLFIGAMIQDDPGMKIAMGGWAMGVISMAATDPRLQQLQKDMLAARQAFTHQKIPGLAIN